MTTRDGYDLYHEEHRFIQQQNRISTSSTSHDTSLSTPNNNISTEKISKTGSIYMPEASEQESPTKPDSVQQHSSHFGNPHARVTTLLSTKADPSYRVPS